MDPGAPGGGAAPPGQHAGGAARGGAGARAVVGAAGDERIRARGHPPVGGRAPGAPRRVGARRLVPGARASRSFKTHAPMTRQPSHSKRPFDAVSSRSRPWPPWPTTRPAPASARSSTPDSPPEPSAPSRSRPSSPSTGAAPSRHTARSDRVRLSAERTQRGRGLFTSVPPIVRAPRDRC